ncbi:uncharacterized protein SPSK_00233 [Sporothrix schenckii 1099-18]|uniref:DUF726 domain protein n=1 Tax=Sporothrix schenckii 1099-18 TaxID=1397361 RepID=A0A0F2M516_SPOSC|nr:uncharacterized protein SPSK_00233 [Sporothrix schenckii 1099-18]KJR83895.1 hypothetical protein SPSK_00233 [Sporothrix schenckii 1099-18]
MASPSNSPTSALLSSIHNKESVREEKSTLSEEEAQHISSFTADTSQRVDQPGENMAPRSSQRGGGRSTNIQRREADLSGIISTAQKTELVLLVASITSEMQEHVCKVFDHQPSSTFFRPVHYSSNSHAKSPPLMSSGRNVVVNQIHGQYPHAMGFDGAQGELKREALSSFQKWQAAVTKRVSEIRASGDQMQQAPQTQGKTFNNKQSGRAAGTGFDRNGGINTGRATPNDARPTLAVEVVQRGNVLKAPGVSNGSITQLNMERRQHLLHVLILLIVSLETYQAYSRTFMSRIAAHLRIPQDVMAEEEYRIALGLSHAASNAFNEEAVFKKSDEGRRERKGRAAGPNRSSTTLKLAHSLDVAKVGSLAGGHGLGSTATASVLGTMGTLLDGGLAVCVFFGMCGPRGSSAKTLDAFTKDVQDVALLPLYGAQKLQIHESIMVMPTERRLRLTIGINGWLSSREDTSGPWSMLGNKSEAYTLNWEQETLFKIGASINSVASSVAWQNAKRNLETRNFLASLETLRWPSSLLKISKIVDNPWSVGMVRADKVGIALADAITNKVHGERGVSMIGYGLGARVIYTCLMSLSERRIFGQVENVLVMGTPAPSSGCVWTALRSVVSGRLVNVFSENDFILGFLHRTGCIQFGVAGLQRIQGVYGIENVDASKPITNHLRYPSLVGRILKDVGWEDLNANDDRTIESLNHGSCEPESYMETKTVQTKGASTQHLVAKEGKKRAGRRKTDAPLHAMSNVR